MKKLVLFGLLLLVLAFTFKAETVNASPKDIWVPYDYPTIQAAINAADSEDVIHVASGTYDPIVVNKSLTLIGEGEAIIDGHDADYIVGIDVTADHVYIYNLKIQNGNFSSKGIRLKGTAFCYVKNNYIRDFGYGIILNNVSDSYVSNNTIRDCTQPSIYLFNSSNNYIVTNNIYNSTWGGIALDSSSSFNIISGNNITIIYTTAIGIQIGYSLNNTIYNNWINCSDVSIRLRVQASNNLIYHNNFIGATNQVEIDATAVGNKWYLNWSVGGNFWSNHVSPDVRSGQHQDQPGMDGICDNHYIITEDIIDAYPLMGPCNRFEVHFATIPSPQEILVISNSSISAFQMNITQKTISFNVSGETGIGFCRVDIPNVIVTGLWQNNYRVLVNNQEPLYMRNWTSDVTTYIYLQYQHSTKEVVIVPEFQSDLIPILLMLSTISIFIKKLSRRKNHQPPFIYSLSLSIDLQPFGIIYA